MRASSTAALRVSLPKVRPFVLTADHNPEALRIDRLDLRSRITKRTNQLELFTAATTAHKRAGVYFGQW